MGAIDHDPGVWLILANRLVEIRAAREPQVDIYLEFDNHDQARVVKEEEC